MPQSTKNQNHTGKNPAQYAPLYVVIFGVTFGTSIAMAKLGAIEGLSPMVLVFWQMLCAGILLGITAWIKGQRPKLIPRHIRYYFIAGILGNAVPTTLTFISAVKIGTGLTGLVYPLSPVFTYAFAALLGMDKFQPRKLVGLALGLMGALFIIATPLIVDGGENFAELPVIWLGIAFTIPIFLACGNIYRSRDWPPDTGSLPLASGMLIATALMLLPVLLLTQNFRFPDLSGSVIDWIIFGNILLSFIGFIVYFELQRTAGPVYFSQISYFITITTMAFGAFLFDETLSPSIWIAIGMIFSGLYLVSKSR
ncbi:MAG: DMT family transporter [Sneathiella sp.]|nr:DMT family transporter [Sneathiella sp.]